MKHLALPFIALLLICCTQPTEKEIAVATEVEPAPETTSTTPALTEQELLYDLMGFEITTQSLDSAYGHLLKLEKIPKQNTHRPAITDTIYRYHTGNTEFKIYKARHKDIFYAATISLNQIQLRNGIHTGMRKSDFFKILPASPAQQDTFTIQQEEPAADNSLHFIFKNDTLQVIRYNGYID